MRKGILPDEASAAAVGDAVGSGAGGGGGVGTMTTPLQVLQVAFRPAKPSGTENERPQPGQVKVIMG